MINNLSCSAAVTALRCLYSEENLGGNPGLVVLGGDSCSVGGGFESQHCMLDGHFSRLFVVKIVLFGGKDENKRKRGREWPIFKRELCHAETNK